MIEIDNLTEEELVDLRQRIVERLKYLEQVNRHESMLKFRPGDRVSFADQSGGGIRGVLVKYNKKTVTVPADGGQEWNVSPGLLNSEAVEGSIVHGGTGSEFPRDLPSHAAISAPSGGNA